jgi:hypothetical protein
MTNFIDAIGNDIMGGFIDLGKNLTAGIGGKRLIQQANDTMLGICNRNDEIRYGVGSIPRFNMDGNGSRG